jgi:diguanylate cyclase (GGDEF)-like protein
MDWFSENQVARSVLDALASSICVIDHNGTIRAENSAWRQFSKANGGGSCLGIDYLQLCEKADGRDSEAAARFAEGIRDVLSGERLRFEMEYPCHSPDEQRWFVGRITPLRAVPNSTAGSEIVGAVISHQDVSDRKLRDLQLQRLVDIDELTGLNNRRSINNYIELASSRVAKGNTLALFLLDLDNFKTINDTFGHDAGDLVIKQAADRIATFMSKWHSSVAARMGGDEFAVLVEIKQPWNVVPMAEELLGILRNIYKIDREYVHSHASIGITFYPTDALSPHLLLKYADLALYKAKNTGRNRYAFYTNSLRDAVEQRHKLFSEVRSGIFSGEFETYFQPIVRLRDKSLLGFEALIRWRHPAKGLLTPFHFLRALRDKNMGQELSQIVLLQVIQHLSTWPEVCVSVNITSGQLHNANFVEFLSRQTRLHSIMPERIKLEITEDVALQDDDHDITSVLSRLRDSGFRISLDDFGTGYGSLSHLSQFPLDEIKIDMSFVKRLNTSRDARAVVRSVTHLAHELGLSVVAEGIEDAETEGIVSALGCDSGQGYLFGKPQPASGIQDLIKCWPYSSEEPRALSVPNLRSNSR